MQEGIAQYIYHHRQ